MEESLYPKRAGLQGIISENRAEDVLMKEAGNLNGEE